jgi:hypothetical protein
MDAVVRLKVVGLVWIVALSACSSATVIPRIPDPAVIVLSNAKDVRSFDIDDGQVSYRVEQPYPAEQAISEIHQRLNALGWHRRERDFLNPGGSSATAGKWGETQVEGRDVAVWAEQWENGGGDIVSYGVAIFGRRQGPSARSAGSPHFSFPRGDGQGESKGTASIALSAGPTAAVRESRRRCRSAFPTPAGAARRRA